MKFAPNTTSITPNGSRKQIPLYQGVQWNRKIGALDRNYFTKMTVSGAWLVSLLFDTAGFVSTVG